MEFFFFDKISLLNTLANYKISQIQLISRNIDYKFHTSMKAKSLYLILRLRSTIIVGKSGLISLH